MPLTNTRTRQLQNFHELLYDSVLPPIKSSDAGTNKHAGSRSSSTRAAVLNAILSPRAPPKPSQPPQRPVRKYNGTTARRIANAEPIISTSTLPLETKSDAHNKPPSLGQERSPHQTQNVVAQAKQVRVEIGASTKKAIKHSAMDNSNVEACTEAAHKRAFAAGLHAMQIRAAAGRADACPSSTPSRRSSTSISFASVDDITSPPSVESRIVGGLVQDKCEFMSLPLQLLFQVTIFLQPSDVAHITSCHSEIAQSRDELASWTFYAVHGISHRKLQSQLNLDRLPALHLHRFLFQRTQAARRAQSQKLAAGLQHSMVVRDGVAVSWGAASSGQLGRGSPAQQFHPIPTAVPLAMPVAMVACGGDHSLLVTTCQTVWAFGRNADGQLGTGNTKDCSRPVEMLVPPALQVACGADHSLVLAVDASVWASGRGAEGQLGTKLFDDADRTVVPIQVYEEAHIVACGADHSFILDGLGHSYSFGENSKGQLGLGHRRNQFQPTKMAVPPSVLFIGVDCGGTHTLLLADDAKVYGCGNNDQRQLGMKSLEDVLVPSALALRPTGVPCNAQRISCGFSYSLVLDTTGAVWVLGGCGPGSVKRMPWRARGALENLRVEDIAAGGGHALCLALGSVFNFAVGSTGQHNDEDERNHSPTPKRVLV